MNHAAADYRVGHVRRVLERVAIVEHNISSLTDVDAPELIVDAEHFRGVERNRT